MKSWLDKYSDDVSKAQNGRATRADSLAVYNNTRAIEDYYKKQGYIKERVKDSEKHKKNIKNAKKWINEVKKSLKQAENAPVDIFYTQQDKNKNIAEQKKYLKEAQQRLSEVNDSVDQKKYLKTLEDSKKSFEKRPKDRAKYVDEQNNLIEEKPSIEKFYLPVDENKFYQREQSAGFLDLRSPMPLYDKRIVPQYLSELKSPNLILRDQIKDKINKAKNKKERDALEKQYADLIYTDNVEMYEYEPLAVMPFDMIPPELQKERVQKYGLSGVPKSIIESHPEWLENTNQPTKIQTLQPKVEAVNIQPISQTPINFPVQQIDSTPRFVEPKSFNISSQRTNMQGENPYYDYTQEGATYEEVMKAQEAAKAYNADIERRYGNEEALKNPKAAERLKQLKQNVNITPVYRNGGEFLGTTDEGFDYNGAWGGQFQMGGYVYPVNYVPMAQMGGNLPGATGNMYARIGAPSNGKYAKKTMASAQNGNKTPKLDTTKLDFSIPKSTGYAWADEKLKKQKKALEEFKKVKTKVDTEVKKIQKKHDIPESTAREVYKRQQGLSVPTVEEVREYTPQSTLSKTWDVITNPMTAAGYVARNEDLPDNFTRGERNNLDMATDVVNPAAWVNYAGHGIKDISSVPGKLIEGDFEGAGESTLSGSLNLLSVIPIAQELKPFVPSTVKTLPKAKNFREALGTFRGIPTEQSLPRLSPQELKTYRQVQEIGRLRATGKPISEQYRYALEQNLPDEHFEKVFGRTKSEVEQILPSVSEQEAFRSSIPIRERFNLERQPRRRNSSNTATDQINNQLDIRTASPEQIQEFADRVGMSVDEFTQFAESSLPPQTRDGVIRHTLSDYGSDADIERLLERTYNPNELRPIPEELLININNRGRTIINGQNPRLTLKETAIDDWERYVDNKVPTSEAINNKFANIVSKYPYYKGPVLENVPSLSLSTSGTLKNVSKKVGDQSVSGISSGDIFTGSLNTSHSSYLPQIKQIFKYTEGAPQFLGYKPMNHLGFLSDFRYSQDDIAKYLNTEIDQQISRGVLPKDILRPYVTNKDRVILPHYGIKQFEDGGVIKDDLGQWAHPGEITEIGSNQITMQGVPYPVLGISDTGDTKLMQPGKDYKFKGKKVTEYPLAKDGKELVKLNQLTNFTNYNTKQPGGWMDKYQ